MYYMDSNYYKTKYLKYKTKYMALKLQQDGGGNFFSKLFGKSSNNDKQWEEKNTKCKTEALVRKNECMKKHCPATPNSTNSTQTCDPPECKYMEDVAYSDKAVFKKFDKNGKEIGSITMPGCIDGVTREGITTTK